MSRIAKYPVALPKGVEATISAGQIVVKGPLGTLTQSLDGNVRISQEDGQLTFVRKYDVPTEGKTHYWMNIVALD